ncbi:class I SAM-dependent methyltransferase [Streptosporangium subroseum]|uniref:class I SAM-dependent methyltransferase n=1 Tax=Streptosporangium subroseum TaxID=106412 RepID=UPI003441602E
MDETRLQKFVDQVVLDMGAAFGAATVVLGDRLGLWKAMAGAGPIGAGELARRTGTNERLIAEWLAAQAASGYVSYDDGAQVVDVGCGHGASTVALARAYPNSYFTGFDAHGESIMRARERAAEAGLADRVSFETAYADDYPGTGYDLACLFDCLHDMGDPTGALRHIRSTLAPDGTVLLVEPFAYGRLPDDLNPVGRLFFNGSATICVPGALSQNGPEALGSQAGPERLFEVAARAGFTRMRKATATPFNLVLELKP